MARKVAIHAAGGIVVRKGSARALVAVVQRSKDDRWVLPRGKLKRDENARAGAQREVVEETGHRVEVKDYLGAITYTVRGQPKVVQFWRMQAAAEPRSGARHCRGGMAAVVRRGAASELRAGKTFSHERRPARGAPQTSPARAT